MSACVNVCVCVHVYMHARVFICICMCMCVYYTRCMCVYRTTPCILYCTVSCSTLHESSCFFSTNIDLLKPVSFVVVVCVCAPTWPPATSCCTTQYICLIAGAVCKSVTDC